ncbi:Exportin-1 [Habropoda laboriosa]|uniref:Exportin-1 n=1 Tax=Habropoda laboriosa TaxID=597456 RepID=A0A0L7RBY9_9HYME|nr:Exportin-1 [Habropoda laboriosa]
MATLAEQASKLLDFNQKLDITLLDNIVGCMYTGIGEQQRVAQEVLTTLKEHPNAWTRVDTILEYSQNQQTKYYALQILEQVIKTRWKVLPRNQCEGIKKYIVGLIIKTSSDPETMEASKVYLNKLNMILVQVLKREWPKNWESFIGDIVGASKTNESLCQNNMAILKLLSEEVFDFSSGQMTQTKAKHLKDTMCSEFSEIFHLCQFVLDNSQNVQLVAVTLETLLRFLNWIPLGYIFETKLISTLVFKFLNVPIFRNITLKCLTEIAGVTVATYDEVFVMLFVNVMRELEQILPLDTNIREAYAAGQDQEQNFIQNLAIFLCTYLKEHGQFIEKKQLNELLLKALHYLVLISEVEEVEIFKICLEYWNALAMDLYRSHPFMVPSALFMVKNRTLPTRRLFYCPVLTKVRYIMISRMAKPEEVLVVENENGEVVREFMKDTDSINLYKNMRETLLCWAIGSISGAMHEEDEKRFLVTVIKDLLGLCEQKKGKDNKAIIASNIMYVVGQYPRFLKAHWKFLKTVVNKLFEFMHETHDGVQDMAFGYMISAQTDTVVQEDLIERYMLLPNQVWDDIISQASKNVDVLKDQEAVKQLASILKTNVRACKALGHPYVIQLGRIYLDMLNVYKVMSENISAAIALNGEIVMEQSLIKSMRVVKKETLKLISDWVSRTTDRQMVLESFIPPLLDAVLLDYQKTNVHCAREPEVLSAIATIVNKLESLITCEIPKIFDAVFECTLEMINKDFEEFPEHRTNFFLLLQAVNIYCFPAFLIIPPAQFKLVLDSIIWAFKHTMRNVADTGLHILYQLLQNVENEPAAQNFYQTYFTDILQHIFSVVTDSSHIAGLSMHATILAYMFSLVELGRIKVPLGPVPDNTLYVQEFVARLLKAAFPHLTDNQLKITVQGLLNFNQDIPAFKEHLRDFLVEIREYTGEDDSDLYLEERETALQVAQEEKRLQQMAVPGILNPHEIPEEMQD